MKTEGLKAFLEQLARDPALRAELIRLAAKHGIAIGEGELSDEELAAVAGGLARIDAPIGFVGDKHRNTILR